MPVAHTAMAGTSKRRNLRYGIFPTPAEKGTNAPAAVAYRPIATVSPPYRLKNSSDSARRPSRRRINGIFATKGRPKRRPIQYPADSPIVAATAPITITSHSSSFPVEA